MHARVKGIDFNQIEFSSPENSVQQEDDLLALGGNVPGELDDALVLVVLAVQLAAKEGDGSTQSGQFHHQTKN